MKGKQISIIIFIALALIWGSAFLCIKKGLIFFTPIEVACIRILIGGIVLLPFTLTHATRVRKQDWKYIVFAGFQGSLIPALCFAIAQQHIDSSVAGVLSSMTPVFTVLISVFIFKERYKLINYIGMIIGLLAAIGLIMYKSGGEFSIGVYGLLIVLAAMLYASNLNLFKYKLSHVPSMTIASCALILAAPVSAIILVYFGTFSRMGQPSAIEPLLYLLVLGVFATGAALILFNIMLKYASPMFAGSITYVIPLVSTFIGILDGEMTNQWTWILTLVLLLSLYLVSKKRTIPVET